MKTWRKIINTIYVRIIKPVFFLIPPDQMHELAANSIKVFQKIPFLLTLVKFALGPRIKASAAKLGDVEFSSRVGLSAGFDKNGYTVPMMDAVGCGFMTVGSITLNPRKGNRRPWFYRLPRTKSLVVHAGLANVGVDQVIKNLKKSKVDRLNIKIIASVAIVASSRNQTIEEIIEESLKCADKIIDSGLISLVEFNISCPNVDNDKLFIVVDNFQKLVNQINKRSYRVPLLVKMPLLHDNKHFDQLVGIASRSDIKGLTIANLEKDRKKAEKLIKDSLPDHVKGGLSGSVTKQHNLKTIKRVRSKHGQRFFIIGVGGIFKAEDAKDYIDAGADAVGMITGIIFEGPQVVGDIGDAIN